jgi:hypothetical protein
MDHDHLVCCPIDKHVYGLNAEEVGKISTELEERGLPILQEFSLYGHRVFSRTGDTTKCYTPARSASPYSCISAGPLTAHPM